MHVQKIFLLHFTVFETSELPFVFSQVKKNLTQFCDYPTYKTLDNFFSRF